MINEEGSFYFSSEDLYICRISPDKKLNLFDIETIL